MKVSQIADALAMEIGNVDVINVCRLLNTMIIDISHKLMQTEYKTISTVANPVEGSGYSETIIDSNYFIKDIFLGSEKLTLIELSESFKFSLDARGLPFYTIEGNILRVTYNEALPLKLRVIEKVDMLEEPFTGNLETNIPEYMLNYVVYTIGSKLMAKEGNWSRQGYYKNMASREAILMKTRNKRPYVDNMGGGVL